MKFETHMHSQTHTSILLSLLAPIANNCSCTFEGKDMATLKLAPTVVQRVRGVEVNKKNHIYNLYIFITAQEN